MAMDTGPMSMKASRRIIDGFILFFVSWFWNDTDFGLWFYF